MNNINKNILKIKELKINKSCFKVIIKIVEKTQKGEIFIKVFLKMKELKINKNY
jgi:hypothetical protein